MNKELEGALAIIKIKCHSNSNPSPLVDGALEIVEQALLELDTIKEASPSEALSRIEDCLYEDPYADRNDVSYENDIASVKQALLELKAIKESNPSKALKCVDVLKEDGCITTLYQGKALETIRQSLLGAQEQKLKLEFLNATLDFTDGSIESSFYHNDIKVIATPYEKYEKLREENTEYEEVLKLVFDRKVDLYHLSKSKTAEDYNSIWDSSTYCLTDAEFDLLKRWQNGKRI